MLLQGQLAGLVPEGVVTGVDIGLLPVDVHNVGTDHVQKVTVVTHDDDRVGEVGQEVGQPVHRRRVQVVRRLIQQQDVRITEQGLRQEDLHLFRSGKLLHKLVVKVFLDAHVGKQFGSVTVSRPAPHLPVLVLQFGGLHAIGLRSLGVHVDGVLLLLDGVEFLVPHLDGIQHGVLLEAEVVLAQHGHPVPRLQANVTTRRVQIPGNHLQKGRLTGTVRADDAVTVPVGKLQRHLVEKHAFTKLYRQIVYRKHVP